MTSASSIRSRLAATGGALALGAGVATMALAAGSPAPPPREAPPRIAVLATVGTPAPEVRRALLAVDAPAGATVVRAAGALDAQAQAAALAARGFDVVAGAGDAGRAAVGLAAGAEVGDGTRWVTAGE